MSVQLNHTIVSCRDQQRSAAFLSGILGLPPSSTAITSARTRGRRSARSSRPGGAWFGNVRFAFRHPDAVHSAGWCTAAATTRPPCWRHWPLKSDQKPRRSLTMIAVIRPAVITLLMIRMLFTPLGTP